VKSLLYEEASCAVERKAMGVVGAHYLLNPSHANMDEGPIVGQQSSVFAGDSVGAAHWSPLAQAGRGVSRWSHLAGSGCGCGRSKVLGCKPVGVQLTSAQTSEHQLAESTPATANVRPDTLTAMVHANRLSFPPKNQVRNVMHRGVPTGMYCPV
jgi:hypothetical protein